MKDTPSVLTWLIVSLCIVTQQVYWLCCCCLPGAESACRVHPPVLSLYFGGELSIWSKIHSACWCLLPRSRSPVAVQYPVCIHKNERENTHREKSFWGGWLILSSTGGLQSHSCLWYCLLNKVPVPHRARVNFSPAMASALGPRTVESDGNPGEQSCDSWYIPTAPMGGQIESQVEMYVLRRTQKVSQSHRSLGYAFIEPKTSSNIQIFTGKEKCIITVIIKT